MTHVKTAVPATIAFRLGTLGAIVTDRFAVAIEELDLKPKHVGVLVALDHGVAASQQDLATRLGVAPSLVVALADHLERLGAVRRDRDPDDRRRQILTLTDHGRALLAATEERARRLDGEFTESLTAAQRTALQSALAVLAADAGLPGAGGFIRRGEP
ncbi:MarR family winged helix-turn-helix transcriptional regulator [Nocardia nova]|uniref:MarR family winged helix-turn-helix transcriptional regulator n=1 Tax=Nocardia nova TaxID=37330 RepID=UPI001894EB26|nr:MarR family winged helix-turn-helix transcriptional regulator [Nocardia nova]MBF6146937.1 winged helix-turn-helix transcriptional regulator [Nocardia nova]MDN2496651.1 winged helix-turn-helix transcriptional regulator [Nocardia nova]